MASTIKLKNGSGAPTTGDLVQGEPALDLTNKRLYTENASGVVIEVGTNPSTIDINAGTIDGTVIGGTTPAAVTGTTITGTSFVSSGDMTFEDNDKAVFGNGSDLRIYHTGSHSTIENIGTGHLQIHSTDFRLRNSAGTESMILANADGNVQLYYDNALKLATTSTGIDVTGTATMDGLTVDGAALVRSGNTLTLNRTDNAIGGAMSYVAGTGFIFNDVNGDGTSFNVGAANRLRIDSNGDISFYEDTGTTAKFFWDASEERLGIGTTSPSVHLDVEGTAQVNLLDVTHDGDRAVNFVKTGANTFSIEHDVNQFYFWNQTTSESPLLFQNDGDVIMNGGNVGIGTSSPVASLDVVAGADDRLLVTNSSGDTFLSSVNAANTAYNGLALNGSEVKLFTNASERMRIDSAGNVGIGTSSPSDKLTIKAASAHLRLQGTSNTNKNVSINYNESGDYGQINCDESGVNQKDLWMTGLNLKFGRSTGSESMRIDDLGNLGLGVVPSAWSAPAFQISRGSHFADTGSVSMQHNAYFNSGWKYIASSQGALQFQSIPGTGFLWNTAPSGTAGNAISFSEAMRIDSSGNLLVGRSSAGAAATDNGHVFYGSGQHYIFSNATECVRFYETSGSGQQVGSISITSSATAFNTSSDERLKENITDAPAGNIDDIKVRSFDWKADGSHQDYGMVAQELEAVAPYAVTKGQTEDDMWSVDYSKLVPMLIKEIQDLKAEVAALKGAN
jgi:hypothetical protein